MEPASGSWEAAYPTEAAACFSFFACAHAAFFLSLGRLHHHHLVSEDLSRGGQRGGDGGDVLELDVGHAFAGGGVPVVDDAHVVHHANLGEKLEDLALVSLGGEVVREHRAGVALERLELAALLLELALLATTLALSLALRAGGAIAIAVAVAVAVAIAAVRVMAAVAVAPVPRAVATVPRAVATVATVATVARVVAATGRAVARGAVATVAAVTLVGRGRRDRAWRVGILRSRRLLGVRARFVVGGAHRERRIGGR